MLPVIPYRIGETPDRLAAILARGEMASASVAATVAEILAEIRAGGDAAVAEHARRFDRAEIAPGEFRVPSAACAASLAALPEPLAEALRDAADNVRRFHEHQRRTSWFVPDGDGVILGKRYLPIDAAGLYVPGGTAPLFSTVLMAAIPAKVAGVPRIAMCTPPRPDGTVEPTTLAAAALVGVDEVWRVGGVQAIGMMAYGTDSFRPVDKIVGPGNAYVQAAKKAVVGTVGIDMIAGPSEIVVIADATADPGWVAADLLSQAEHGSGLEAAVAVVMDRSLAERIAAEVARQAAELPRESAVRAALDRYGAIFLVTDLDAACELANRIAPEHVELQTADPWALVDRIRHAGAIFLGAAATEAVGDYFAGTNHILPTGRAARYASSLGVDDFLTSTSLVAYTGGRLEKTGPKIVRLAEAEGLQAHARAVARRLGR